MEPRLQSAIMLALGVVALAVIIHTLRQVAHDVRAMRRRKALENTRD